MITTAISMCLPFLPDNSLSLTIESVQKQLLSFGLPRADRIYIGSENCEFLLERKLDHIKTTASELRSLGYNLTLVTSPTVQKCFEKMLGIIEYFDKEIYVDEIVFNDIGLLHNTYNSLRSIIRVGRHFDKIIREARFDFTQSNEIKCNLEIFETPWICQNQMSEILKKYGVSGVELDTVPGAVMKTVCGEWDFSVWYPDVILSYCTTCEFAGSCLRADKKFVPGRCACECTKYYTELRGNSFEKIIKIGRAVLALNNAKPHDCISGNYRVVMSAGYGRYLK